MAEITLDGGDQLAKALTKISKMLGKGGTVQVGFFAGATYPNGTPVAMIAAIQNYGAPSRGIPPRPFFTNMVKDKSPSWPNAIMRNLQSTNYDVPTTLARMGEGIADQLRESIIDTYEPALSPVTVMLRGMRRNDQSLIVTGKTVAVARRRVIDGETNYGASTKPLIDTSTMLDAIGSQVTVN